MTRPHAQTLRSNILIAIIMAVTAIAIALATAAVEPSGDGVYYKFIVRRPHLQSPAELISPHTDIPFVNHPVSTLADIAESQAEHFHTHNGRTLAHSLAQLFSGILGQRAFGAANALVWIALILLTATIATRRRHTSPATIFSVAALLILSISTLKLPPFEISYVWMLLIAAFWIRCFFKTTGHKLTAANAPLLLLLGLAAGNGQEVYTIPIGGAILLWAIRHFKELTPRQIVLGAGFAIGAAICILAPANFHKAATYSQSLGFTIFILFSHNILLMAMVAVAAYKCLRRATSLRAICHDNIFWLNIIAISLIFNTYIGAYAPRMLFMIDYASVIVLLRLLRNNRLNGFWMPGIAGLLLAFFIIQADNITVHRQDIRLIESKLEASADGVVSHNPAAGHIILRDAAWSKQIFPYVTYTETSSIPLRLEMSLRHPGLPPIRIIPDISKFATATTGNDRTLNAGANVWIAATSSEASSQTIELEGEYPWTRFFKMSIPLSSLPATPCPDGCYVRYAVEIVPGMTITQIH